MTADRKTELRRMLLPDSPMSLNAAIAQMLLQAAEELSRLADALEVIEDSYLHDR
jgi:hypothetical protein